MATLSNWAWPRSLAVIDAGRTVQVDEILFGVTRDHCEALGIHEGSVLTCRRRTDRWVEVELPTGLSTRMPRDHAWFVSVHGL